MKFTAEEFARIEGLIACSEASEIAAGVARRPDPLTPSSYAFLIAVRRARFRKSGA